MRILIVDDDENVAQGIRWMLNLQGYEAECCASAEAAMVLMEAGEHELVISDLRLPGRTGLELLEWVAATHPETRRILITGFGSAVDEQAAARLSSDLLIKPFSSSRLLDAVERALTGEGSRSEGDPGRDQTSTTSTRERQ